MALRVFRVLRVLLGCLMFPARLGLPALKGRRVLSARLGLRVRFLALRAQPGRRVRPARRDLRVLPGLRVIPVPLARTAFKASRASRVPPVSVFGTRARSPRSRSCPRPAMSAATFGSSAIGTTIQSLPTPMCGMKISRTGCMPARFKASKAFRVFRDRSGLKAQRALTEPPDPLAPKGIPAIRVLPVKRRVLLAPRGRRVLPARTAPLGLPARRATLAPPGLRAIREFKARRAWLARTARLAPRAPMVRQVWTALLGLLARMALLARLRSQLMPTTQPSLARMVWFIRRWVVALLVRRARRVRKGLRVRTVLTVRRGRQRFRPMRTMRASWARMV